MARDEFPTPIKEQVSRRAAFHCSNPDCRVATIGADQATSAPVLVGKVAHITAAASNGPRYNPLLTQEQRKAADNAIFLCGTCSDLIDKNGGASFPVAKLREWKQSHEKWTNSQINRARDAIIPEVNGSHLAHGIGEVTAIDIEGPAIIKPGTISRATGVGNVTATRIRGGNPKKD